MPCATDLPASSSASFLLYYYLGGYIQIINIYTHAWQHCMYMYNNKVYTQERVVCYVHLDMLDVSPSSFDVGYVYGSGTGAVPKATVDRCGSRMGRGQPPPCVAGAIASAVAESASATAAELVHAGIDRCLCHAAGRIVRS